MKKTQALGLLDKVELYQRLPPPAKRYQIRKRAGLSAIDIANYLGVTLKAVYQWEKGVCNPRAHRILAYVNLLEQLERLSLEAHRNHGRIKGNLAEARKDLSRPGDIDPVRPDGSV